jgi:hypothetical protein
MKTTTTHTTVTTVTEHDEPLTPEQWDAVAKAERRLFGDVGGLVPYTDVNMREETPWLRHMWEYTQNFLEHCDDEAYETMSPAARLNFIGSRVAKALCVMALGSEGLLK